MGCIQTEMHLEYRKNDQSIQVERLLNKMYAARINGNINRVCFNEMFTGANNSEYSLILKYW